MNQPAEQQQSKALANPIDKLCASLVNDDFKAKLAQALPQNISVEKYCRTVVNAIQMHPQQEKFKNCDVRTVFLSCQKAAADGLMLDGREATLIAFYNKEKRTNDIAYVPMVQGLVKAARNSGEIAAIDPHVVYENDSFQFRPGLDSQPVFEPNWKKPLSERGEPCLAYCVITLKDGTVIAPEPMHKERILSIGRGGNNAKQYDPKTGAHWAEWWKKTAIKNALKYAPKSSELLALEEHDNEAQQFRFERDISGEATLDINEQFKPRRVNTEDAIEAETVDNSSNRDPVTTSDDAKAVETSAADQPAQGSLVEDADDTRSPAFQKLSADLDKATTAAEIAAIFGKEAFKKMNKKEQDELNKLATAKM